jgi:hypothetical protein
MIMIDIGHHCRTRLHFKVLIKLLKIHIRTKLQIMQKSHSRKKMLWFNHVSCYVLIQGTKCKASFELLSFIVVELRRIKMLHGIVKIRPIY